MQFLPTSKYHSFQGRKLKKGDLIGKCGNSGSSTAPHIHLQIQSEDNMWSPTNRTFPLKFLSNSIWIQPKRNLVIDAGASNKSISQHKVSSK